MKSYCSATVFFCISSNMSQAVLDSDQQTQSKHTHSWVGGGGVVLFFDSISV